jgi:large-conductance mechanosensitive channel
MDTICQNYDTDPSKNMYYNGCNSCKIKDYPTNSKEIDDYKERANTASIILVVIIALIIFYFLYVRFIGYEKSVFSRIRKYYGNSFSQLTFAMVAVFLTSDLVSSLNSNITYPVINSVIPGEGDWNYSVCLPRGEFMLPGRFFKSLINFVISGGLIFILIEILGKLYIGFEFIRSKTTKTTSEKGKFIQYIIIILVVIVLVYLVVGNYKELNDDKQTIRVFNKPIIKN